MKTKSWMPWVIAVAVNAGIVWMAFLHLWAADDVGSADFIGADGPFSIASQMDLTTAQSPMCEVHKLQMSEEVVPVYSALPVRADGSREPEVLKEPSAQLRAKLFPHCGRHVVGTFAVGDVRDARIHVCPECRRAEERWRGAQGVASRRER